MGYLTPYEEAEQRIASALEHNFTSLYLDNLGLRTIPESIGELHNLERLFLGGNDLNVLPISLRKLSGLTSLELYDNKFKTLPDFIGEFKNLNYLKLSKNPLEILPDSLGELEKLKALFLFKTPKLHYLPYSMRKLNKLSIYSEGTHNEAFSNWLTPSDLDEHTQNIRPSHTDSWSKYTLHRLILNKGNGERRERKYYI